MDSAQRYFLFVTLLIGFIVGIAISILFYAFSQSWVSFLMTPLCMVVVFFQMISNAKRKARQAEGSDDEEDD